MRQCRMSSGYRGTCKGESAGAVPSGQKKEYADKAGADRTAPVRVKGGIYSAETEKQHY